VRLALFQPDIPQNLGAAIRLGACLGVGIDVIEPCGFPLNSAAMRRAHMDYGGIDHVTRHDGWATFKAAKTGRVVLLTTAGSQSLTTMNFAPHDVILVGRESAGVPESVHGEADLRVRVPMRAGARSLNVINAAAVTLWEALRQTGQLPKDEEAALGG
jgi:tRNA (cytidine/uridine-2'-O-)-methyltransferase